MSVGGLPEGKMFGGLCAASSVG